jgi:hypothetical protein
MKTGIRSMDAKEYREWLDRHHLTHKAAGELLGFHATTSLRYSSGAFSIPLVVALAIETLNREPNLIRKKKRA